MPTWLRYISYCLPLTFPAEAMRSILGRGAYRTVIYYLHLLVEFSGEISRPSGAHYVHIIWSEKVQIKVLNVVLTKQF